MTERPILRPMLYLRAVCRITASLTGKTAPARSRALLYAGHSGMAPAPSGRSSPVAGCYHRDAGQPHVANCVFRGGASHSDAYGIGTGGRCPTRLPPPSKIWLWEAQVVASPAPRACVPAIARDRHRLQHEAAPTMQRAKATPGAALAARITKRARNFG